MTQEFGLSAHNKGASYKVKTHTSSRFLHALLPYWLPYFSSQTSYHLDVTCLKFYQKVSLMILLKSGHISWSRLNIRAQVQYRASTTYYELLLVLAKQAIGAPAWRHVRRAVCSHSFATARDQGVV